MDSLKKIFLLIFAGLFLAGFSALNGCQSKGDSESGQADTTQQEDTTPQGIDLSQYDRYYNDMARLLAGLEQEPGSELKDLDTNELWRDHQRIFGGFFEKVKKEKLAPMSRFSQTELKQVNDSLKTLFYPFSGPDFIHANIFFPDAQNIVMFGLESVGDMPDLREASSDDKRLKDFFNAIDIALDSIFRLGYFMTFEMGRNFNRVVELNGVLPIITIFMSQSGYRILNIKNVTVNKQGELVDSIPGRKDAADPHDDYISGGMIEYMKEGDLKPRKLIYFSHDVSEQSLAKTPEFITYLKSLDIDVTFLKAASYLCTWMHTVRDLILSESDYVFQDDSGIPVKYFETDKWDLQFYGKYKRTLKVFYNAYFQSDLKKIYETDTTVKPLDFGIGYGIRIKQSNLMLARKKQ